MVIKDYFSMKKEIDKDRDYSKMVKENLPSRDLEVCEENLEEFFRTMIERQKIYVKRFISKKKAPWTKDEILKNYKFTNVYRELDRNTQFQIENVFNNFYKVSEEDTDRRIEMIWRIMFFRFFNNIDFFEFIFKTTIEAENSGYEEYNFVGYIPPYNNFNSDVLKEMMDGFRSEGGNPFTNAYCTNTVVCTGFSRDHCFAYTVIPKLHSLVPELEKVMRESSSVKPIIKLLLSLPSVSNFMAHEFYQDFTYAPKYSRTKLMKFNQDDFTNVGPGAELGIRLIFPERYSKSEKEQGIYDLRDLSKDYLEYLGGFPYLEYDFKTKRYNYSESGKLTLHQIEMWLCEYSKYWKMKIGEGKQRSSFKPRA